MSGYTRAMNSSDRRRAERLPVDIPAWLYLSDGRHVSVRIKNLGEMGALVQIPHLEIQVVEGDRVVLEHPHLTPAGGSDKSHHLTPCAVVRVEVDLDFEGDGVRRELAIFFDGGPPPEGFDPSPQ
jgi:hypothetical protein